MIRLFNDCICSIDGRLLIFGMKQALPRDTESFSVRQCPPMDCLHSLNLCTCHAHNLFKQRDGQKCKPEDLSGALDIKTWKENTFEQQRHAIEKKHYNFNFSLVHPTHQENLNFLRDRDGRVLAKLQVQLQFRLFEFTAQLPHKQATKS